MMNLSGVRTIAVSIWAFASSTARVMWDNVSAPSSPSAPSQVLKEEQILTVSFENHNIYADPEISPVTSINEADSHGPDPKLQFTRMQDIGDGIRVSVPPPDVDYNHESHRSATSMNTKAFNSNNNQFNSNNIGSNINYTASDIPRSRLPSMPPAYLPSEGMNGAKTVNSNNYNVNSGNIGSNIGSPGQWPADASWAQFQQSLFQQFTDNPSGNNINSNNGNFNSGNHWSNIG